MFHKKLFIIYSKQFVILILITTTGVDNDKELILQTLPSYKIYDYLYVVKSLTVLLRLHEKMDGF